MSDLPINKALTAQLDNLDFGEEEIDARGIYARPADRPIGVRLRTLQDRLGATVPQQLASWLDDNFEVWLVPHRVSVIRRTGSAEPVSIGIEVEYLNGERTCSVLSLLPSFDFVVHGGVNIGLTAAGRLSPEGEFIPGDPQLKPDTPRLRMGQLELGLSTDLRVGFRYRATVSTPLVSATGIGSARCEWRFDKDREPLFGRDIETWAVLALPWGQRQLEYRMRFYLVTRMFFFPTRLQSAWTNPITCQLVDTVNNSGLVVVQPKTGEAAPKERGRPPGLHPVAARLGELRTLKDGWLDGAGKAPPPGGLDWLADTFQSQFRTELPLPYLYPTPQGGIQAEWSLPPFDISLAVDVERHRASWHCINLETNEEDARELQLDQTSDWQWLNEQIRSKGREEMA